MKTTKQEYRALFLALQADAKAYPGGITAIASAMGCNGNTLANGLNPNHEAPPPSFPVILEVITVAQAQRAVRELARLVGQVPIDLPQIQERTPREAVGLFLGLVQSASDVLGRGSAAAQDGMFTPSERREVEPLLAALIQAAAELQQALRG